MKALTLHDRVVAYNGSYYGRRFPDSQLHVSATGRWVYGTWNCGNFFKNRTRYPGAYPRTVLERILAIFPEVRPNRILHLFAGAVRKGRWTRLDLNPTRRPEIVGSVYDLPALLTGWPPFHLFACDPPYRSSNSQALYGTDWIDTAKAFRAMAEAAPIGTHVSWLDTAPPLFQNEQWHKWGSISIERSTGNDYREVGLYTRATEQDLEDRCSKVSLYTRRLAS